MGAKFKGDWKGRQANARAAEQKLLAGLESAMKQAVEFAVEKGVDRIEASGTGKTWAYPSSNGRAGSYGGRVDTGDMRDGFGSETELSGTVVTGQFGWLEGSPFYFLFQEYGFKHWITGEMIEGMRSLRDADEEAWPYFLDLADQHIQEYINAL